ncbi:hypothetical protein, partial [Pelagibius sp.]|uniref:hypothetical protein n=1 Tax=Pelagibius sp. TaxID=1931238 RepID=UPI002623B14C
MALRLGNGGKVGIRPAQGKENLAARSGGRPAANALGSGSGEGRSVVLLVLFDHDIAHVVVVTEVGGVFDEVVL